MTLSKQVFTTFGALALFLFSGVGAPINAQAINKDSCVQGLKSSEEIFGGQKFQVSRLVINAPAPEVQAVLTDYGQTTRMFPNVKKCQVVEDGGALKKIAFTASAPANLWTFEYVLEVKESPGYIEWHRVSGAFKRNEGFWKLEPLDEGRSTLVTYAKFVDGGLLMPQPLVTRELRASMPEVMSNLKSSVDLRTRVAHVEWRNH